MQLPSLNGLVNKGTDTFLRFPFTILLGAIFSFTTIFLIQYEADIDKASTFWYFNLIHVSFLGISLTFAASIFAEQMKFDALKKNLVLLACIVFLAIYYFFLPKEITAIYMIRAILLAVTFHCLVAIAPFIMSRGKINGFWNFNKTLFLRILLSVLYSGVLYLGIALAILAFDQLFNMNVNAKVYPQLWFLLAGIFNTWFFLSGIPSNFEELEQDTDYPFGLKVFTQYVLLPLVTIYLGILYLYIMKIIVNWELPKGWVSYLVLGFSIAGILSLLLVYPLQNSQKETWIKIYARWFYIALFPLIILLFVAIWTRISDYGITENRYFILLVALWLAGISIYLLVTKLVNIKMIPITLSLIALLSSFGPWGAFYVSQKSQLNRLEKFLNENNMIKNGKVIAAKNNVTDSVKGEISSIVNYLIDVHGNNSLQPLFSQNLDSISKKNESRYISPSVMNLLGITYNGYSYVAGSITNYYFSKDNSNHSAIDVSEYQYYVSCYIRYEMNDSIPNYTYYTIGKDSLALNYNSKTYKLTLKLKSDSVVFDIKTKLNELDSIYKDNTEYSVSPKHLIMESQSNTLNIKLNIETISANFSTQTLKLSVNDASINMLVALKNQDKLENKKK